MKKVAIIFGGKSTEHEVSLSSASNIYNAIDKKKFDVILIGINKKGAWFYNLHYPQENICLSKNDYFAKANEIIISNLNGKPIVIDSKTNKTLSTFDLAFPIIHGNFGEDGTLQGYFKTLSIPFVGSDVLSSAICMDKDISKKLLRSNGIPIVDFLTFHDFEKEKIHFELVKEELGLPLFIKPANGGSSVGISKATDEQSFYNAIKEAFKFDKKILIEQAIKGREVECAVLGNENPKASLMGEIIPTKEFYSYEAKYKDAEGAILQVPANIEKNISDELRTTAIKAFQTLCCEGMARVDFFLKDDNSFLLNEVNTIPGFTEISMYPKLWVQTGILYPELIAELIQLAIEKAERDRLLQTNK